MVWFLFWPKNVMTIWWLGNLRYRGKEYMLVFVVHYKYECYEWWNSGNSWITFELVHYRRNLILFSFAQPWSNSSVMNVEILDMFLPSIRDLCQPLARSFLLVCLQEHLCGTWENDGSIKQISNQRSVGTWHCPKMSGQLWRWFEWSSEAPAVPRTSSAATPSKTKIIKSNENEWGVICQKQRPLQVWIWLPPHFYFWKNQQKSTFCGDWPRLWQEGLCLCL